LRRRASSSSRIRYPASEVEEVFPPPAGQEIPIMNQQVIAVAPFLTDSINDPQVLLDHPPKGFGPFFILHLSRPGRQADETQVDHRVSIAAEELVLGHVEPGHHPFGHVSGDVLILLGFQAVFEQCVGVEQGGNAVHLDRGLVPKAAGEAVEDHIVSAKREVDGGQDVGLAVISVGNTAGSGAGPKSRCLEIFQQPERPDVIHRQPVGLGLVLPFALMGIEKLGSGKVSLQALCLDIPSPFLFDGL